jgi:hypothetical protein
VADYVSPGTGTPEGIESSQQVKYFSAEGWWLPANTGGAEYELCFDGIATKTGSNSYSGAVTIIGAPEVSTWAMTLLGFAGLGFMGVWRGSVKGLKGSKRPPSGRSFIERLCARGR